MPIDRPASGDHPHDRGERADRPMPNTESIGRLVAAHEAWERRHGPDQELFRDNRPVDGTSGAPSREHLLYFRYDEANKAGQRREAAGDTSSDQREHPPDERAIRFRREVHEAVRENLPEVDRKKPDRQYPTTADIFDENGKFLRREVSGETNPDNSRDTRVDQATHMAKTKLGWQPIPTVSSHAETKTAVDVVNGTLPKRIAMFINNTECNGPRSCREFMTGLLRDGREITVYDYYGQTRVYPERPNKER